MMKYLFIVMSLINFSSCGQKKLDGFYVGVEKVKFRQLGGAERQQIEKESQNPNREFFKISYLQIRGDSVFLDNESFTVNNQDTIFLNSDGIGNYFDGTYSLVNDDLSFNLQEVVVNYFEHSLYKDKNGRLLVKRGQKQLVGQLAKNGVLINSVVFKKSFRHKRLISQNPELFKER